MGRGLAVGLMFCVMWCVHAVASETHFFEAESMPADGASWSVSDHVSQQWYYSGAPSRGQMLNGGYPRTPGATTQTVAIVTGGAFKVWVRYADCQYYRGPFVVTLRQGGIIKSVVTNDLVSLHASDNPTGQATWGADYQDWVWVAQQATLSTGVCEIVLSKYQAMDAWLAPLIDCFVVSSDLTNQPDIGDFAQPLYVKVKLSAGQTEPCVIHLFGKRPYAPDWYLPHVNFYSNRVAVNDYYTGYQAGGPNTNFLSASCESPWLSLGPILTPVLPNVLWFTAIRDYVGNDLSTSSYSVIFSTNASDSGIIHQFSRSGNGNAMLVRVDMTNVIGMQDDLAFSQADVAQAGFASERPTRFPIMTTCSIGSTYRPATFSNELQVMRGLGFNGTGSYDPAFYSNGLDKVTAFIFDGWGYWSNNCMSDIRTNDLHATIASLAQPYITAGVASNMLAWYITDEPSSETLDHMMTCSNCVTAFRLYVQAQGMQPSNFGATVWSDVYPTNSPSGNPQTYYQSVCFRAQLLANNFRAVTDALHEVVPGAQTTANFAEELTINGNLLASGADWFTSLRQGALTYGWTESWLTWSATYQMVGYRADFMRAATTNGRFGLYNIMTGKTPWDMAALEATLIGHGANAVYDYAHGPSWGGGTPDGNSDIYSNYPTLHNIHAAIARVEDHLLGAQVPTNRFALIYAHATDVWTLNDADGYSEYGKERMGLFLILRHLGCPVDIVTEDDIVSGKLSSGHYQAAFLSGSHLRRDAAQTLVTWTTNGGCFYFNAGSMTYDEYNQPLNLDASLGLSRQPYVFKQNCGREIYELPTTTNNDPVSLGGTSLEGIIGVQKLSGTAPTNAVVLATFVTDGSSAMMAKTCGKGHIIFCGTFPGLAYQKSGVLAKQQADQSDPSRSTYCPPSFGDGYRWLFSSALAGIGYAPPAVADDYRIETCPLVGTNAEVIALANWAGQARSNVVITLTMDHAIGQPAAALGTVVGESLQDGLLTLTLDRLDEADFITIPFVSNVPVVSSNWVAYNDAGWSTTQSAARVTVYSAATNISGMPMGGPLLHFGTGTGMMARIDFSANGSIPQVDTRTAPPPPVGSDADRIFSGRVNLDGWVYWSTGSVALVFSNLEPARQYDVALYANRGAYTERYVDVRISGALSFANHSSTGAIISTVTLANDKTRLSVNNTNGLVFRYDTIQPGANGQIQFTLSGLNVANSNTYLNAIMIQTTPAESLTPDSWKLAAFGVTSGPGTGDAEDYDHDGFSNYAEWRAGTDPTNANSRLDFTTATTLPAGPSNFVVLTWAGVTGKSYTVLADTNLATAWLPIKTGIVGVAPINAYTTASPTTRSYWKVNVE